MRYLYSLGVIVAASLAMVLSEHKSLDAADAKTPDPESINRARDQVKMLDDLYKSAVVGITSTYVDKQDDTPAAAVAKKLFEAMHNKGYHFARLIDASGKPKNKDNIAASEFEKKAAAEIKAGKKWIEEVGQKDGKPVFRAATVVPVVMKQCMQCHPGTKEGDVLGTIVYELPIK